MSSERPAGLESQLRDTPKLQANCGIIVKITLPAKCQHISLQNIIAVFEVVFADPPRRSSWSRNRICPHVKSQESLWDRPLISCQKLFPVSHSFAEQTQKMGSFGEGFGSQWQSVPSVQAGSECLSVPFTTSTLRPKSTHMPKDSSLMGNQENTGNKRFMWEGWNMHSWVHKNLDSDTFCYFASKSIKWLNSGPFQL